MFPARWKATKATSKIMQRKVMDHTLQINIASRSAFCKLEEAHKEKYGSF